MKKLILLSILLIVGCSTDPTCDNCGVCDTNTTNDCIQDCKGIWGGSAISCEDDLVNSFNYTQSIEQAFYFIESATINGTSISANDYVIAYKDSVCVGYRKWDRSLCNNDQCELPVMGMSSSSSDLTVGYMQHGESPDFMIYDASAQTIYPAVADSDITWENMGISVINLTVDATCPDDSKVDCHGLCDTNIIGTGIDGLGNDECNICEGSGAIYECGCHDILDGNCDCTGNTLDCNGDCGGSAVLDKCGVCNGNDDCDINSNSESYQLCIDLHAGANLISFPALPSDVSVSNMFSSVEGVIGQGVGAVNLDGTWIGSLTEVSQDDGYWVKVSNEMTLCLDNAVPINYDADGEVVYSIGYGNNLISYPFQSEQTIADALGSSASNVYALAGQGVAALNIANDWVGSLSAFEGSKGYWLVATSDFSFSFNGVADGISRIKIEQKSPQIPEQFKFIQSTKQAFYFVENVTINNGHIDDNDIIIAYNGDVVVGSRYWNGNFTDIPAMGIDDIYSHNGYCRIGDEISFKIYDASNSQLIDMWIEGNSTWSELGISVINLSGNNH
jgi:hypothetical protein